MRKKIVKRLSMVAAEMLKEGKVVSMKQLKRKYLRKDAPQGKPFDQKAYDARMRKKKTRAKKREEAKKFKKAA